MQKTLLKSYEVATGWFFVLVIERLIQVMDSVWQIQNVKSQDVYGIHRLGQCFGMSKRCDSSCVLCHWAPDILKNANNCILTGQYSMPVVTLPWNTSPMLCDIVTLLALSIMWMYCYTESGLVWQASRKKPLLSHADVSQTNTSMSGQPKTNNVIF